jgi:hypothetical protein
MPFEDFVKQFFLIDPVVSSLTITEAIGMISCHRVEILKKPKVPVFIFIDEVRQLTKTCEGKGISTKFFPEMDLLRAVARALHSPDQPTFLISTLDYAPLKREGMLVFQLLLRPSMAMFDFLVDFLHLV